MNPAHPYGSLSGSVQTLSLPHRSISHVQIWWSPEQRLALTDAAGAFMFDNVLPQNGYLCFSSPEYRPDSLKVSWQGAKQMDLQFYLNHNPQLERAVFFSSVLHRHPNLTSYAATVQVWIQDPDMDIDSVWVQAVSPSLHSRLAYDQAEKCFSKSFTALELSRLSLPGLVGQDLSVQVADMFGYHHLVGVVTLKRLVMEEVEYVQPSSYAITTNRPRLQWKRTQPGFPFTYLVEIYSDDIVPGLVWQKAGLAPDAIECTVDQSLPAGDYFWIIWCVDEFGNRSRSKPATFTVP